MIYLYIFIYVLEQVRNADNKENSVFKNDRFLVSDIINLYIYVYIYIYMIYMSYIDIFKKPRHLFIHLFIQILYKD